MPDIFVSYARSTESTARRVAAELMALDYSVWRDDQLPAHRAYGEVIEEHLRAAKAVLVLWSADAVKSQWVRAEAEFAREARTLVQISLDDARLPLPFNQIQCAQLNGWDGDRDAKGWATLLASLAELVGVAKSPVVVSMPARPTGMVLAVLAFDNLSADPDMAFFSDGVSEEILQAVSRGSGMSVIARSSSFQFRGATKSIRRISEALKVTHLLDGSVRRSGPHVRISAQLVECASETTLWSKRFDGELSDVFALQDEIAEAVADALKVTFAPSVPAEPIPPTAYDLLLRARNLSVDHNAEPSIELLRQAVAQAPHFAAAWAALSWARAKQARRGPRPAPFTVLKAAAAEAAQTALRLDPEAGLAYATLSSLQPIGHYRKREQLLNQALAVAPSAPETLTLVGAFYNHVGFIGEAVDYLRRAHSLDPLYPQSADVYCAVLHASGRVAEAITLCKACQVTWPEHVVFVTDLINSAAFSRDWTALGSAIEGARASGIENDSLDASIRFGEALRDNPDRLREQTRAALRRHTVKDGAPPLPLLLMGGFMDLRDEVYEAVASATYNLMFDETGSDPGGIYNPGIIFDPHYSRPLMEDPRFVGLCHKLNLCEYWVAIGRWPDCAEDVPYDFKAEAARLVAAG